MEILSLSHIPKPDVAISTLHYSQPNQISDPGE